MLALLKYPFYPMFNFDNGMNVISKSLTILTSVQLLVVFAFAHIFWRNFVFAGFWPILEHEMARPTITRWHEERRRPKHKVASEFFSTNAPDPPHWTQNWCFDAFRTIWVHSGPFAWLQNSVRNGRTSAKVSATKSRQNFSQRTHPNHPIRP